ncbi:FAD-binding oxidoreductase [soil metagenome]
MTTLDVGRLETARPGDLADARDLMLDSGRDGKALLLRGGGTKLDWGAPPERTDLVVDTTGLSGLVAHNPEDSTAVVQAGMPLAALQEHLADSDQWLAVDPPETDAGATVGGVVATNSSGPRRLRYGSIRDLVIGVTIVLPDGSVARAGGHVIKNVAGFDLMRLVTGSFGTLALVAEVVVRLHPLPGPARTVGVPADAATATAVTLELLAAPVEPVALDWSDVGTGRALGESGPVLWVRLQGSETTARAQADAVGALAGRRGLESRVLAGDEEAGVWRGLGRAVRGQEGETVVRATTVPSGLADVASALEAAALHAGVEASMCSHAGLGLHTARLSGADAAAHAAVVRGWRGAVAGLGGAAVVRRRVPGLDDPDDIWGDPPSSLGIMRSVKEALDPQRRLAPGRFPGGL